MTETHLKTYTGWGHAIRESAKTHGWPALVVGSVLLTPVCVLGVAATAIIAVAVLPGLLAWAVLSRHVWRVVGEALRWLAFETALIFGCTWLARRLHPGRDRAKREG